MLVILICFNGPFCPDKTVITRISPISELKNYSPHEIYAALQQIINEKGLKDRVRVAYSRCIWGCSVGPRLDVIISGKGKPKTILYGSESYIGDITMRPNVKIISIKDLESLENVIFDNLE